MVAKIQIFLGIASGFLPFSCVPVPAAGFWPPVRRHIRSVCRCCLSPGGKARTARGGLPRWPRLWRGRLGGGRLYRQFLVRQGLSVGDALQFGYTALELRADAQQGDVEYRSLAGEIFIQLGDGRVSTSDIPVLYPALRPVRMRRSISARRCSFPAQSHRQSLPANEPSSNAPQHDG